MRYLNEYKSKLQSSDRAMYSVPSVGTLSMGMAASEPQALLKALEKRVQGDLIQSLRVYYMHSEAFAANTILKYEYMDFIKPHPFYMGSIERSLTNQGLAESKKVVFYMPGNFSGVPSILNSIGIDVFILSVSPMDKGGFFSCGTNSDYTIPVARKAKRVIVEVNPYMPRAFGDCALHISDVHAIVENECPLIEMPARASTDLDRTIGGFISEMIPDRACIQMGVGGVPNAVCEALASHKDLGVHSELMAPGLVGLIQSGVVSNRYKKLHPHKNVYTLAMGDKAMYEFINDNSGMEAYPVDYVNNTAIIAQNENVISVNAFLEIDLSGQVNAEFMNGRQFSAPGGQLDFVRGSQASSNGKSILASSSTAAEGKISRIVPRLKGPVTDPRGDVQYIVTEHGVADLRGKSSAERAMSLIEIAHPCFQNDLLYQAKEMGYF